jgi:acetyltransferase-like isoleucine patch superfamily enzyme
VTIALVGRVTSRQGSPVWFGQKESARDEEGLRRWKDAWVHPTVQILGEDQVTIGRDTVIGEHGWINVNFRDQAQAVVKIGAHAFIGRRNFLNAGKLIELGDFAMTGPDCRFLGADHRWDDPFQPYVASGMTEGGEIRLGTNCWLGAGVTILKDVTIGFGSIIGAASLVNRSVPPLAIAAGSPARVLRRYCLQRKAWVPAEEWEGEPTAITESEYRARLAPLPWSVVEALRIATGASQGNL